MAAMRAASAPAPEPLPPLAAGDWDGAVAGCGSWASGALGSLRNKREITVMGFGVPGSLERRAV